MKEEDGVIHFGDGVKIVKSDDGTFKLGGFLVRFTSPDDPDIVGEYFTSATDYGPNKTLPLFYHHGLDSTFGPKAIGEGSITEKDAGLWYEAQVAISDEYMERVKRLIEEGRIWFSSGPIGHMVAYEPAGKATRIKTWVLAEASLTPSAAEPRNGVVPLKALYTETENEPDAGPEPEQEVVSLEVSRPDTTAKTASEGAVKAIQNTSIQPEKEMEDEEKKAQAPDIGQLVKDAVDAAFKAHKPDVEPDFQVPTATPAKFANLWRYDNCDTGDLSFAVGVLNAHHNSGKIPAPETALKALAVRLAEIKDPIYRQSQHVMKALGMPMKANELNQSTLASYGDEWAGVTYSNALWESIRQDTPVVGRIPTMEVPQGSESVTIPLESTPPTFYKVAQASAQAANPGAVTPKFTSSRLGTANQSLTVGKLGAMTIWTGEMDEDSVVAFASELRSSIQIEGAAVLESLVIDGDTATGASTNINDIAGTPGGTESFLVANGFRKLALVTNTANSRDGGTLAVEDFLETLKLMGLAGKNALQRDKVAFILDLWTHWKSMELTEIKTRDVFVAPTIENGRLANIYGYDVIPTANMHRPNTDTTYGLKANSAGKLDQDTASNNTTGSILAVRFDQWRMGWKRRMTIETERIIDADATRIVAHMRVGLINRDTEASAISYNLTL